MSGLLLCFYVRETRPGALRRGWLRLACGLPAAAGMGREPRGLSLGAWAQGSAACLGRSGPGPPAAGFVLSTGVRKSDGRDRVTVRDDKREAGAKQSEQIQILVEIF